MTVVSTIEQQSPSLQFDGETVTVGDQSFDVTTIDTLTTKVKGGIFGGHRVVWTVRTLDGQRHEVTLAPAKTASVFKRIDAVLTEQRKAREAAAETALEAGAVAGTVTIVGQSFPATRREDGEVVYTDRAGKRHRAVGPHRRSFQPA